MVTAFLYRGSEPKFPDDLELLKTERIRTIIDLEGGLLERLLCESDKETENSVKGNFRVHFVRMSDLFPPSRAKLEEAFQLIVTEEENVLVHCAKGKDRTGAVIAYFRRKRGWPRTTCLKEMFRKGFHLWYIFWIPRLWVILK